MPCARTYDLPNRRQRLSIRSYSAPGASHRLHWTALSKDIMDLLVRCRQEAVSMGL